MAALGGVGEVEARVRGAKAGVCCWTRFALVVVNLGWVAKSVARMAFGSMVVEPVVVELVIVVVLVGGGLVWVFMVLRVKVVRLDGVDWRGGLCWFV